MLREMLTHTFAFREPDGCGWLPLHRAASQPVLEVLEAVVRREYTEQKMNSLYCTFNLRKHFSNLLPETAACLTGSSGTC